MGADSTFAVRRGCLLFRLAEQTYALPGECVEEIVPMAELSSAPGAPSFLSGFLEVAGRLVAVISLRRLWKLPDRARELYTPIVILKSSPRAWAIEVDAVTQIVEMHGHDLVPIADGCSLNDCAVAIARVEGSSVVLLSPDRILLEQEQKGVAELSELVRQRLAEMELVTA